MHTESADGIHCRTADRATEGTLEGDFPNMPDCANKEQDFTKPLLCEARVFDYDPETMFQSLQATAVTKAQTTLTSLQQYESDVDLFF